MYGTRSAGAMWVRLTYGILTRRTATSQGTPGTAAPELSALHRRPAHLADRNVDAVCRAVVARLSTDAFGVASRRGRFLRTDPRANPGPVRGVGSGPIPSTQRGRFDPGVFH